jgi:YfiR/HmsC-like
LKAHGALTLPDRKHSFSGFKGLESNRCFESDMQIVTVTPAKADDMPSPKRLLWLLGALILIVGTRAQSQTAGEYQIKAAFLYNFAKFVEWPASDFGDASGVLRICVFGQDPFGQELRDITNDKSINGHKLQVDQATDLKMARTCHILFISSSEKAQLARILESLRDTDVLTVGDMKGFVEQGGMINFVLENDRVRFEVNLKAAEQARLKVSSKLLHVARNVVE